MLIGVARLDEAPEEPPRVERPTDSLTNARPALDWRSELGEHGHPKMILRRALERGNRVVAEITARELGHIDLGEALELTALIAKHERLRLDRLGARWLQRWLDETPRPTLDDAGLPAAAMTWSTNLSVPRPLGALLIVIGGF